MNCAAQPGTLPRDMSRLLRTCPFSSAGGSICLKSVEWRPVTRQVQTTTRIQLRGLQIILALSHSLLRYPFLPGIPLLVSIGVMGEVPGQSRQNWPNEDVSGGALSCTFVLRMHSPVRSLLAIHIDLLGDTCLTCQAPSRQTNLEGGASFLLM